MGRPFRQRHFSNLEIQFFNHNILYILWLLQLVRNYTLKNTAPANLQLLNDDDAVLNNVQDVNVV